MKSLTISKINRSAPKTSSSREPVRPANLNPKLIINNSFCKLVDFPPDLIVKIKKSLTFKDETIFHEKIRILQSLKYAGFARKSGRISSFIEEKMIELQTDLDGYLKHLKQALFDLEKKEYVCWLSINRTFPTGLLGAVKEVSKDLKYKTEDVRKKPSKEFHLRWKTQPPEPWPFQTKLLGILEKTERGVVESCVGSGKTLMFTYDIQAKGVTSLIVVPSGPLLEQIGEDLETAFGSKRISIISSAMIEAKATLREVRIVTYQTMASLLKKGQLSHLLKGVNSLYIDEFHHSGSDSITDLLPHLEHIYYRYGFTGTFMRNDSKTMSLHGVLSERIFHYPAWQAIKDGFLTKLDYLVYKLGGIPKQTYQSEYKANYCGSKAILDKVLAIVSEIPADKQILILVKQKENSGDIIHKFLNYHGISNTYVTGDDKRKDISKTVAEFNKRNLRILVASKVLGEGINIRSTDHLILATGGKSPIELIQALGRCARLFLNKKLGYIHDLRFVGTKFLEDHTDQRIEIFKEEFRGEVISK